MSKVRLLYRETPQSGGVPQLEDPSGRFSHEALKSFEAELSRAHQRLVQSDGQVVTFTPAGADLPTRYRVRVKPVKNRRCPLLELIEESDARDAPKPTPIVPAHLPDWSAEFIDTCERLLPSAAGDRAERTAISYVLEELRELTQIDREEVIVLLLAGYLYAAEGQCLGQAGSAERIAFYRLASRVVDAWCTARTEGSGKSGTSHTGGTSLRY